MSSIWNRILFFLGFEQDAGTIITHHNMYVQTFTREGMYVADHREMAARRAKAEIIEDLLDSGALQIVDVPQTEEDRMNGTKRVRAIIQASVGIEVRYTDRRGVR